MRYTVIGAANIKIITKSKSKIVPGESNPAEVRLEADGVARNIASLLAHQGEEVDLIAAVGNDPLGALLRDSCKDIGVNADAFIVKNNISTGINLSALENSGELYAAFTAITAPEQIKAGDITKHKGIIKEADLLVLDLNLTEKTLEAALELRGGGKVFIDAVSVDKVQRIGGLLQRIDILKLNRLEAERLTGISLDTKERVKQACYYVVGRGTKRVYVTLGMAGVCAADNRGAVFVPAPPTATTDIFTTEAFSTGLAINIGKDLRTQAELGMELAAEHNKKKR
jgi:pseudouridine kinase